MNPIQASTTLGSRRFFQSSAESRKEVSFVLNIDVGLRSAGRPISALRRSWSPRCASRISESESSSESCINDTASGSYDSARASAGYVSEYVQVCGGSIRSCYLSGSYGSRSLTSYRKESSSARVLHQARTVTRTIGSYLHW